MSLILNQQTAAQFATRLREAYKASNKEGCARIATWIINRITIGDVTDTQVRNAFGLTVNQYTTLKTKMQTLKTNWEAVQSAQGE